MAFRVTPRFLSGSWSPLLQKAKVFLELSNLSYYCSPPYLICRYIKFAHSNLAHGLRAYPIVVKRIAGTYFILGRQLSYM